MISADWPGIMENELIKTLGTNIPVFPFIAPQGNINHLEFHDPRTQSGYEEAERLGAAYAGIIAGSLESLKPVRVEEIRADEVVLEIPPMDIPGFDLAQAEKALAKSRTGERNDGRTLTAEDLAKGDPEVERIFAESLVDFARNKPAVYRVPLQTLVLGRVAFAAIPGEPFVEIGLRLKAVKGFDLIFPTALANGYVGYIPLEECFGRGGYETRPGAASYLAKDADTRILEAFRSLLRRRAVR
jgi:hypothetical protein